MEISITDDGIGIAPDELDAIFGLFARSSAARKKVKEGMGVGLAVVQDLVQRNGGKVTAQSVGIGRGTTFTVHIPFHASPEIQATARRFSAPKKHSERILIVDDNRDLAGALGRLLRRRGHAVECAYDGAEALRLAGKFKPSFCLVDIALPDLGGFEITALLAAVGGATLRIVTMSGFSGADEASLSEAVGAISHLQKPVEMAEVEALLDRRRVSEDIALEAGVSG